MHGRLLCDWEFGSLSETTAAVDLVVVGRIVSVYVGRTVGTDGDRIPMAWMDVSVDEVLKGEPQSRKEGIISIELEPTIEPGWDKILANVPEHQHVFFLMNEEQHRFREALPPFDAQLDRYTYFRPNDQAVLRLVSGRLWLIEPDQLTRGRYPSELQGQPFSDVRAAILASVADSDSP
jgi:hypothetical protein